MGTTAIYRRLSVALDRDPDTGELDERNLTIQEAELRREAERRKWKNITVYTEHGISAGKKAEKKRKVFYGELWRDIEAGRVDRVLFWATDRCARYQTALLEFADFCEKHEVDVEVPAQGIHLTPGDDRMVFAMHGAIAESESRTRSRRSKAYRERYREQGRARLGGRRAFGWNKTGTALVPKESERIREAVTRLLAGEALYRIVREWNEQGIKTSGNARWRPGGLRKTLLSQVHVPTLISEDEHALLEGLLVQDGRAVKRDPIGRRYPLTGVLICGRCGQKLLGAGDYYRCAVNNGGCGRLGIKAYNVERFLAVETLKRQVQQIRRGKPVKQKKAKPEIDTGPVLSDLRTLKDRQAEVEKSIELGEIPAKSGGKILFGLEKEHAALTKQLARALPADSVPIVNPGDIFTSDELQEVLGSRPPARLFTPTERKGVFREDDAFRQKWRARELDAHELGQLHDFVTAHVAEAQVKPAAKLGSRWDDKRVTIQWRKDGSGSGN